MKRLLLGLVALLALGARAEATNKPAVTWHAADTANYTDDSSRPIDMIVIHKADGSAASAWNTFQDPSAKRSAHYVVDHDGSVTQMVSDMNIAWHAGNWPYNVRSLGIENGGYVERDDITSDQMRSLAQLVASLCEKYGIPEDRSHIVGHDEVPDPNNPSLFGGVDHHTDPGPYFDWDGFMKQVHTFTNGSKGSTKKSTGGSTKPTTPPSTTKQKTGGRAALRTTADLNVRDAAWGRILAVAPNGTTFVGTGWEDQGFAEIWYGGRRAFVSTQYVEHVSATGGKIVTQTAARSARKTDSSNVIGQAHKGEIYASLGVDSTGVWRKIQFDTKHRWVTKADTQATKLTGPASPPSSVSSSDDPFVAAVMQYKTAILDASGKYGIDPWIIAGVIERESEGVNIVSDGGHGYGLMSIDDRAWPEWIQTHDALDPEQNIDEGTKILKGYILEFGDVHKGLNAYNSGDAYGGAEWATTGGNYGTDVLARAENYKGLF